MKSIICPKCGKVDHYFKQVMVTKVIAYNAEDQAEGVSEESGFDVGDEMFCECGETVKIVDEGPLCGIMGTGEKA